MSERMDLLKNNNVDTDGALERLGGVEDIYFMILPKFLSDTNYSDFIEDMKTGNVEQAILHIHSLKGVAYNLGFNQLGDKSAEILASLRANDFDAAKGAVESLKEQYDIVYGAVEKAVAM